MRRGPRKQSKKRVKLNSAINAPELRVLSNDDENLGIMSFRKALELAKNESLDLVEISDKARPPIVKIVDYGKYQYHQNKLKKEWREQDKLGSKKQELKQIQIKIGTDKGIMEIRSKKIDNWLEKNNKVRIDLFLVGRYKSMKEEFLKSKLETFLEKITVPYTRIEDVRKSGKGFSILIQQQKNEIK